MKVWLMLMFLTLFSIDQQRSWVLSLCFLLNVNFISCFYNETGLNLFTPSSEPNQS